jgi:K(+)-stimulated pyrophosphate-energized sodium pump
MQEYLIYSAPVAGAIALAFAFLKARSVTSQDEGDEKMKVIAKHIQDGAAAFLKAEYKVLAIFVVVVAVLLAAVNMTGETQSPLIAVSFVLGAFASGLAGWIGMAVATKANVRTTAAARESLPKALAVAFNGGTVMGMTVVGLALVGLGLLFIVYTNVELKPNLDE